MSRDKLISEVNDLITELHNKGKFGNIAGEPKDTQRLQAYSNFLSAKVNEEMLNTIKNYQHLSIGFAVINLVFFFINLWLLAKT